MPSILITTIVVTTLLVIGLARMERAYDVEATPTGLAARDHDTPGA